MPYEPLPLEHMAATGLRRHRRMGRQRWGAELPGGPAPDGRRHWRYPGVRRFQHGSVPPIQRSAAGRRMRLCRPCFPPCNTTGAARRWLQWPELSQLQGDAADCRSMDSMMDSVPLHNLKLSKVTVPSAQPLKADWLGAADINAIQAHSIVQQELTRAVAECRGTCPVRL